MAWPSQSRTLRVTLGSNPRHFCFELHKLALIVVGMAVAVMTVIAVRVAAVVGNLVIEKCL